MFRNPTVRLIGNIVKRRIHAAGCDTHQAIRMTRFRMIGREVEIAAFDETEPQLVAKALCGQPARVEPDQLLGAGAGGLARATRVGDQGAPGTHARGGNLDGIEPSRLAGPEQPYGAAVADELLNARRGSKSVSPLVAEALTRWT